MNHDTQAYLDAHFLRIEEMAAAAGIAPRRLRELVDAGLVPAPSYVARGPELVSAAFGSLACAGLAAGEYMHRGMQAWIAAAFEAIREHGDAGANAALRRAFATELGAALSALRRQGLSAPDGLDANGQADDAALDAWIDSLWQAHMQGIFGVCVRNPGDIAAIANKETAQALLGRLTDNGDRQVYSAEEAARLRALIARYAEACAPFTPLEYPRSSRKRYVEDLPKRLAG